jgi:hypothetical protein
MPKSKLVIFTFFSGPILADKNELTWVENLTVPHWMDSLPTFPSNIRLGWKHFTAWNDPAYHAIEKIMLQKITMTFDTVFMISVIAATTKCLVGTSSAHLTAHAYHKFCLLEASNLRCSVCIHKTFFLCKEWMNGPSTGLYLAALLGPL